MKYLRVLGVFLALFFLSSNIAFAASVQSFGMAVVGFINTTLLPFIFAIALVIFIYQMIRYFLIDPSNHEYKETARNYAIYAILAFVLMVSIWGIVNLFVVGTGFDRSVVVCPDTIPRALCSQIQGEPSRASTPSTPSAPSGSDTSPSITSSYGGSSDGSPSSPSVLAPPPSSPSLPSISYTPEQELAATYNILEAEVVAFYGGDTNQAAAALDPITYSENSDEVRVRTVADLYETNVIGAVTAKNYIDAINRVRQSKGEPFVFSQFD